MTSGAQDDQGSLRSGRMRRWGGLSWLRSRGCESRGIMHDEMRLGGRCVCTVQKHDNRTVFAYPSPSTLVPACPLYFCQHRRMGEKTSTPGYSIIFPSDPPLSNMQANRGVIVFFLSFRLSSRLRGYSGIGQFAM